MRILVAFLVIYISSFGSINSQFVFPNQQFFNSLPVFPNQFQYPFNTNNNNNYFNPPVQQTTTTSYRPYYAPQQVPYQQQPSYVQQTTRTTNRPYFTQAPQRINYQQNGKRISEQKCEEYVSKTQMQTYAGSLGLLTKVQSLKAEQCDVSQGLIIGGVNTKVGEFPHMVAIGYGDTFGGAVTFGCGGSLISERFVLTAAHCDKVGRQVASVVRIGDRNLKEREEDLPELDIPVDRFIAHEQYDKSKRKNDIALVKLSRDVPIGKFIRPACLMTPNNSQKNTKMIATGWGLTVANSEQKSDILQKVDLSLISNDQCGRLLDHTEFTVDNRQLCAGALEGGKDTCQGDSGGPLQVTSSSDKCVFVIVGVTSYGISCGQRNSPGIYTKVSAYLDWIENKVWGS